MVETTEVATLQEDGSAWETARNKLNLFHHLPLLTLLLPALLSVAASDFDVP